MTFGGANGENTERPSFGFAVTTSRSQHPRRRGEATDQNGSPAAEERGLTGEQSNRAGCKHRRPADGAGDGQERGDRRASSLRDVAGVPSAAQQSHGVG